MAAKENERQMSEIFLTSSELTDYVRSVIQLIGTINFFTLGGGFITYASRLEDQGYHLPLETGGYEVLVG